MNEAMGVALIIVKRGEINSFNHFETLVTLPKIIPRAIPSKNPNKILKSEYPQDK